MQRFFSTGKGSMMRGVAFSLIFSTLFVAVSVGAATTISSNISTGGTLSVTGASTLTGLTTMVYASSTGQSMTGNIQIDGGMTVGSAVANPLAGSILLQARSSDPTGVTQGTFYYNSTNKTLKMFDGTSWFTVGTTTGGISLSNNHIKLDDSALRDITFGTTTQQSAGQALVTLEATTTTSIPLSIVGFTSHTGHLLDVLNVSGAKLFYISSSGGLFGSSTAAFGGTLTVGGALTATSTVTVTGLTTLGYASSTGQSLTQNLIVNGYATTTGSSGNFATQGSASSTSLIVGGNSVNGTLAGLIHGTCNIVQRALIASTTGGFACTSATGITTSFKVFVSATTTLAGHLTSPSNGFAIVAASSTADNTIGVELSNLTGLANTPAGTLNFWAVR
ncbi:MAG: hypothetical protein Q7R93_03055 [bacterium]|nr:hypothetical protein [bacterium]